MGGEAAVNEEQRSAGFRLPGNNRMTRLRVFLAGAQLDSIISKVNFTIVKRCFPCKNDLQVIRELAIRLLHVSKHGIATNILWKLCHIQQ